jgi:beta-lactamase class A
VKTLDRRHFALGAGGFALLGLTSCASAGDRHKAALAGAKAASRLAALEAGAGGRLGVALYDVNSGRIAGHRLDARFTMCSTFKFSLAAAILAQIDAGTLDGSALIPFGRSDLIANSPVTTEALAKGALPLLTLAHAAQTVSDNAASNLLLRLIGGPEGLTRFWRSLGDHVSRLDRYEPDLNHTEGDDPRDTTAPTAIARTMAAILTGTVLKPASRARLIGWMVETRTGMARLRAGLPSGWRAGDKTGTVDPDNGRIARTNDLAAIWPQGRGPVMIAAFYESPAGMPPPEREATLAQAGRIATDWIGAS